MKIQDYYAEIKYGDKHIIINGDECFKAADENGPEIKGKICFKWFKEMLEDDAMYKKMNLITRQAGCTFDSWIDVRCKSKSYTIPINIPKDIDKKLYDEIYEFAKAEYFDLFTTAEFVLLKADMIARIDKLKEGEYFKLEEVRKTKNYLMTEDERKYLFEELSKIYKSQITVVELPYDSKNDPFTPYNYTIYKNKNSAK